MTVISDVLVVDCNINEHWLNFQKLINVIELMDLKQREKREIRVDEMKIIETTLITVKLELPIINGGRYTIYKYNMNWE